MPYTELYMHLLHGHHDEAVKLVRQRKNLNTPCGSFANTPLHVSSVNCLKDILSLLLDEGANVNSRNRFGETPLHLSVMMGHETVTTMLLDHDADPTIKNDRGEMPFDQPLVLGSKTKMPTAR